MEQDCMEDNRSQFSQFTSAGTPFTQQPLLREFSYLTVGENTQKVLKGEFEPPPNTDEYTKTPFLPFYT